MVAVWLRAEFWRYVPTKFWKCVKLSPANTKLSSMCPDSHALTNKRDISFDPILVYSFFYPFYVVICAEVCMQVILMGSTGCGKTALVK